MFFTNTGRVYVERVHEIPDMGRAAKGRSIANLLELKADEKVAALIRILSKTDANKEDVTWSQSGEFFFATQQGTVKKTSLNEFSNVRKGGIIAIGIEPGDTLIDVKLTRGSTGEGDPGRRCGAHHQGRHEHPLSRSRRALDGPRRRRRARHQSGNRRRARGGGDCRSRCGVAGGRRKRHRQAHGFDEYRVQSRGGKGIITMKTGDKTGGVVGALTVRDTDEIMLITVGGQMVRIPRRGHPRSRPQHAWASNSSTSTPATSSRPSPRSSARTRKIPQHPLKNRKNKYARQTTFYLTRARLRIPH